MAEQKSIAVVGGGLVGPLQALFLAQAGFEVHVYEKRSDLRGTSEYLSSFELVYMCRSIYVYLAENLAELLQLATV